MTSRYQRRELSNSIAERSKGKEDEMTKNNGGGRNDVVVEFLFQRSAPKTGDIQTSFFFLLRADYSHVDSYRYQYKFKSDNNLNSAHNFSIIIIHHHAESSCRQETGCRPHHTYRDARASCVYSQPSQEAKECCEGCSWQQNKEEERQQTQQRTTSCSQLEQR